MKIYYFDEKGLFLYEDEAELDPAEWQINHKKVYMIPEFATKIKPPKTKENQTALFNGKNWKVVADYREQYICDSQMNLIYVSDVGELPEGYIPITAEQAAEIEADKFKYIIQDGKLIENPNYEADKKAAERERIGKLSLTKREVFLALFNAKGITPEQVRASITDTAALIEFDYATEYFRGNPLIDAIGAQLGYTSDDLDYLFENKVLPQKEEENE